MQTMLNFPKTLFNLSIEYQQDILNVYHMCKLDLVPTSDPNAAHTEWSNLFLAARKLLHRAPPIRDHEQRSSQAAMRMRCLGLGKSVAPRLSAERGIGALLDGLP